MSYAGRNLVSYPNISDLRYSNSVDLFKILRVPYYNFAKTGQASSELDNVIKKRSIYVRGPVSAANKFSVPGKIDYKFCLTYRYCFVYCSPDISFHTEKTAYVKFYAFTTVTFYLKASNNTTIRLQLSSLLQYPKVSAAFVQLPLRIARWSTILLDFSQIFKLCFGESIAFAGFLQFEASATIAVKGVYFSNVKYSPFDSVEILRLQPPTGYVSAQYSNLIEHYDWIEYGVRPFSLVKQQNAHFVSQKDIFSHNFSGCLPYNCQLADFQAEYEEFCLRYIAQNQHELSRKKAIQRQNGQKSQLSQSLSTYRAAKVQTVDAQASYQEEIQDAATDDAALIVEVYEERYEAEELTEAELTDVPVMLLDYQPVIQRAGSTEKSVTAKQCNDSKEELGQTNLSLVVAEQLIKDQLGDNIDGATESEINELKNAYKIGKRLREDDYLSVNKTLISVKVVYDEFKEKYQQRIADLHSTFVPQLQAKTIYSALNIRNIIGCEVSQKYSVTNMDVIYSIELDPYLFGSSDQSELTTQAISLINNAIGAPVLYYNNGYILVNASESYQYYPEILPNELLILLLNHVICASVVIPRTDTQLFISYDFVINALFKIQHANRHDAALVSSIDAFIEKTHRCNVLFLTPSSNNHFLVAFDNFCAIFQLIGDTELKLRAVLHNSVLKICYVEKCAFVNNGQSILLAGTNMARSSLAIAFVDISKLLSVGSGWLTENYEHFSVISNAICMESLSKQQKHECVGDIIELSSDYFVILTNQNMRFLRIKDGFELRLSSMTQNFLKYKQQLIAILEAYILRENKYVQDVKRSQDFDARVHELVSLYINSSNISHAGMVPGSNRELMYLVLSNVAIVRIKVADLLQGRYIEVDGFLPHGFVPILCLSYSEDQFILTSDLAGNVFCHDGFCGKLLMEAKFKAPIIFSRASKLVGGYTSQSKFAHVANTDNVSSQMFTKNSNLESFESQTSVRQFIIIYKSGELAVFDISESSYEYSKCYPLPIFPTHDFAFDPNHSELMMTTSAFDGNIVNMEQPSKKFNNYISTVTYKYLNASQIKYTNIVRYHPSSFVTAIFYPDYQQITLTDLNSAQTFYCSTQLFPTSAGLYDMNFTQNGDHLVIASSLYGIKIYQTKEKIGLLKSSDLKAIRVETASIIDSAQAYKDIIICIDMQRYIKLQYLDALVYKAAFRDLDIKKEPTNYIQELGTRKYYIPAEHLESQFYKTQISHIKVKLSEALASQYNSSHELILGTPIRPEYDPAMLYFIRRKVLQIGASQCVPNLLTVVVSDVWRIPSISKTCRKSIYVQCLSLEGYSLVTGRPLNSVQFTTIVDDRDADHHCCLVQSRIHGTYCCILSLESTSYVYSLNIIIPVANCRFRLGILPFHVKDCKIAYNSDKLAISHTGSSIFLFDWNCSNYCSTAQEEVYMKEELARGVIELRLEKLVATSGICQYSGDSGSFRSGVVFV